MRKRISAIAACVALTGCSTVNEAHTTYSRTTSEQQISFETRNGEVVDAFKGSFSVPENRSAAQSRTLNLKYVRFPATTENPGPPIVYLAGGPGGSGIRTAKNNRFPLFMALRAFGDVIAFDQRGTGASNDLPRCVSPFTPSDTEPMSDDAYITLNQRALKWCVDFWTAEGIDLHGYTTVESVGDLRALREHLGAEKISLWGTSYGSHLSLAALKYLDDEIDRVIVSSVEGLNQTIKRPARTDAYFTRLQTALASNQNTAGEYPDILAMMHRVHQKLESEPILVDVPMRDGSEASVLVQRRTMRQYAAGLISDPRTALGVLAAYKGLDEGDTAPLNKLLKRWHEPLEPISFRAMPVMMDIASGITDARRVDIEAEAETAVLGSFLNGTLHLLDAAPAYDLGDDFREKPKSDVPTLVLSGTLDGRTYIESQLEATDSLSAREHVRVVNAGHNLFMSSAEVTEVIEAFMSHEKVDGQVIDVEFDPR